MTPAIQVYVAEPKLGELLALAYERAQIPVVLAGFNKQGNWQVLQLNSYRQHKKGISAHHETRLTRLNVESLSKEQKEAYDAILKTMKK